MKIIIKPDGIEFIAKILCDLGKAVLTVGFASYFFEKLPLFMRIGFGILGIILLFVSVIMFIKKGDQ